MNRSGIRSALFVVMAVGSATAGADPELSGYWSCPATMQLAAVGQNQLTLKLDTRSHLRSEGRYESEGDAIVQLGMWPLPLSATSHGSWAREQDRVTVTVESLELSPGSTSGVELQRYMIQQLRTLFPVFPHTQVAQILVETSTQLVLEDAFGEQYTCTRL